jgi:hypothetical protein
MQGLQVVQALQGEEQGRREFDVQVPSGVVSILYTSYQSVRDYLKMARLTAFSSNWTR